MFYNLDCKENTEHAKKELYGCQFYENTLSNS